MKNPMILWLFPQVPLLSARLLKELNLPGIQTLWTVPDTDRIRGLIKEKGIKTAAVIGGGFIGLEMAENLRHARS